MVETLLGPMNLIPEAPDPNLVLHNSKGDKSNTDGGCIKKVLLGSCRMMYRGQRTSKHKYYTKADLAKRALQERTNQILPNNHNWVPLSSLSGGKRGWQHALDTFDATWERQHSKRVKRVQQVNVIRLCFWIASKFKIGISFHHNPVTLSLTAGRSSAHGEGHQSPASIAQAKGTRDHSLQS